MGYAFVFTLLRLLRVNSPANGSRLPIGAYVHYPTISTDMLRRVQSREAGVTNDSGVAGSAFKTALKLKFVSQTVSISRFQKWAHVYG